LENNSISIFLASFQLIQQVHVALQRWDQWALFWQFSD